MTSSRKKPGRPVLLRRTLRLADGLRARFGVPRRRREADLLDSLIRTFLSQSTTDHNRDLAFDRLKRRFPHWDAVAEAGEEDIVESIRPAGLGNQKAGRIRDFLRWLRRERGELSLEFLHSMETEEAVEILTRHNGIGIKTAYVTLMIAAGRDIFPVDVHVHRICRRLGLIGEKTTPEKAHGEMAPLIPPGRAFELHMNLLAFGRTMCRARNPRCETCEFRRMCLFFHREDQGMSPPAAPAEAPSRSRRSRRRTDR